MDTKKRIEEWPGGSLRVFGRRQEFVPTGEMSAEGAPLHRPELRLDFVQEAPAQPWGNGFALLTPTWIECEDDVRIQLAVREGRPQCVAIESGPNGPELTQTVLRRLGPISRRIRDWVPALTVRLELDAKDQIIGIHSTSPLTPADYRSFDERTTDIAEAARRLTPKTGRPSLTDDHLREVGEVVIQARRDRRPEAKAVMQHFHLSLDAAKKHVQRAKKAGYTKESHNNA